MLFFLFEGKMKHNSIMPYHIKNLQMTLKYRELFAFNSQTKKLYINLYIRKLAYIKINLKINEKRSQVVFNWVLCL